MLCLNQKGKTRERLSSGGIKVYKEFCFVDFASARQPGFRNNIVRVGDVPGLVKRYKSYECYATSFFFRKDLREYVSETGSVGGYDGAAFAPFLILDIDDPDIGEALESARKVLLLLLKHWGIQDKAVHSYFSGSKGFHIMIDSRVFGDINPSGNLHIEFAKVRETISKRAGADMDLTIKDKLRLFRIPNTINRKSGLFKIQLSIREIMELKTDDIIKKAEKPLVLVNVDSSGLLPAMDIKPNDKALNIYAESISGVREGRIRVRIDHRLSGKKPEDVLCEARKEIWQARIQVGLRHNCAMRILSQFHISGFEKEKALRIMNEWNHNKRVHLPQREIISMVESVYSSPHPYSYGCRDSILRTFCPYRGRLKECRRYMAYMEI